MRKRKDLTDSVVVYERKMMIDVRFGLLLLRMNEDLDLMPLVSFSSFYLISKKKINNG